jgi:hypothetical protein
VHPLIEHIQKEWAELKSAPGAFVILAVLCILTGLGIGSWHYSERLEEQAGQISRYRVALGIDKGGPNALAELTNTELQAKGLGTASKVRDLCFSFQKRSEQIGPAPAGDGKVAAKEHFDRVQALMREVSQEFDHDLKSDFLNANNELLRRLDRKAVASVVRGPIFTDADTGTPIGMASLTSGEMEAPFLCTYADQMEQMAKLLPAKSGK